MMKFRRRIKDQIIGNHYLLQRFLELIGSFIRGI